MFLDEQHPDVSLSDWEAFRNEFSPCVIETVLDRSAVNIPHWFVPLARGAAIPSSSLLRRAGYRPSYRARGWSKARDEVWKDFGEGCVAVAGGPRLWRIERDGSLLRPLVRTTNLTLAHIFGSTPILARSYQAATCLAEFCFWEGPPPGLCWAEACPDDVNGAIKFAQQRRIKEAMAARSRSSSLAA
jgi:hypothetical protein